MAQRVCRRVRRALAKPNAAAVRGLAMVRAALASKEPGPTGEHAIALLEQQRREMEAGMHVQGVLVLREAKP